MKMVVVDGDFELVWAIFKPLHNGLELGLGVTGFA